MSQRPLTCGQIMANRILRVQSNEDLLAAVSQMNASESSSVIVEESGKTVGLINESDIIKFVQTGRKPSDVSVREIMSSTQVAVKEDTSVEEAVHLMLESGVRRLPVLRGDVLVGLITSTNILAAISKGLLTREVFIYLSDIFRKETAPAM